MKKRFEQYRELIGRAFYGGRDPGDITETSDTGDKHLHGDAVARIDTSEGKRIFYKPRDCRSTDLLGEVNEILFGVRMVPEQVEGNGFAFQKEVIKKIPGSDEEKQIYYSELGRLTAVFYALGSSDMHRDNILCTSEGPVVVDTETVLCPKAKGVGGTGEFSVDYGEIFPEYLMSVGESMVLPRFFGMMQMSPMIPVDKCRPDEYEQTFIDGFIDGYERICDRRDEIGKILDSFADIPLRYLLRSTQSYGIKIWRYQNAKSEEDRQKVIKSLYKGLSPEDIVHWRAVLDWEEECIREGDIPYFWLTAGGRALMGDISREPLIADYLELSPIDYAKWRMGRMNSKDMDVQIAYTRASLKHTDGWEKTDKDTGELPNGPLSVRDAVSEVEQMIKQLREECIPLSGDRALWHTPLINGRVGCLFGIGEGFSGVALFARKCADSPLITGECKDTARELAGFCFNDLASFAEFLLKDYPTPPEERAISRRFNGGFDPADGLKGLLIALDLMRDEDPQRTETILNAFGSWGIGYEQTNDPLSFIDGIPDGGISDRIEGGRAGKVLKLLSGIDRASDDSLTEAGVILAEMKGYKDRYGCYKVYMNGRRQYFLPAFLRGSTGIGYTMLRYAEIVNACNKKHRS